MACFFACSKAPSVPMLRSFLRAGIFHAGPFVLLGAWVLGCWVRGCSVGDLGCHFAGVAPCWLHPATHTNVLGFKGPWYGAGVRRWLHPLADASARWSLMCALWLHHGDHSLALLSWVAATPGQKKNLTLGCLPPSHRCAPCWLHPTTTRLCTTVIQGWSCRAVCAVGCLRHSAWA